MRCLLLHVFSALLFVFLFCSEAYSFETIDLSQKSGLIRVTAGTPLDDDVLEETEDGLFFDQIDGTLAPTQAPVFSAIVAPHLECIDYSSQFEFIEPKVPLSKLRYSVHYSRPPPETMALLSFFSYDYARNFDNLFVNLLAQTQAIQDFSLKFNIKGYKRSADDHNIACFWRQL